MQHSLYCIKAGFVLSSMHTGDNKNLEAAMELKIGEQIAKYRKAKGYTQERLGEVLKREVSVWITRN